MTGQRWEWLQKIGFFLSQIHRFFWPAYLFNLCMCGKTGMHQIF